MAASKYEDLIDELGDFGSYQKVVFYLLCIPSGIKALVIMTTIFILSNPSHRCAIPGYGNDTYEIQSPYHRHLVNLTIPYDDDGQYSKCSVFVTTDTNNRTNCVHGNDTTKCDRWVYDPSAFCDTIISEYDMVCDERIMRSHMNMSFFAGSLVGSLLFGILADVIGRKKALFLCILVQLVCGTGIYFAESLVAIIILRAIQGSSGEMFALSASTGMELVGSKTRTFAGMVVEFFWSGGQALVLVFAYFTESWRLVMLLSGVFALPMLIAIIFLPESPRWLLEKKRYDEVDKILQRVAKSNKTTWSSDRLKTIDLENTKDISVFVIFRNKRQIYISLVCFYNWFAINFLYYGITLSLDNLAGNLYLNFMLNVVLETFAFLVCFGLLTKLGRKTIHASSMVIGAVSCTMVVFPVLYGANGANWTVTGLALIGKMCASACYSILYIMTVELFPTGIRNSVLGICAVFENSAGMVAPYIADLGILYGGELKEALPLLIFGGMSFLAGITAFTLPETRDKPMVELDDFANEKPVKKLKESKVLDSTKF